jgi:hypothetical protein
MRILLVAVVGMALMGLSRTSIGQMPQPMPAQQPPPPGPTLGGPPLGIAEPIPSEMQEQQARARSSERQLRLVADTDKLLALATELKQEVSKTNKDVLSVDVVKKADEIEKLAHSVKERMKG